MTGALATSPVAFHISLNVSDIGRTAEFFSKVFGAPPTKLRSDYAKFELENPPITLSLEPVSPADHGSLNHVGFKLKTAAELVELQRRLELAGIRSEREEGVECCYAKQTKFWLHDPDGTLWEMYVLEGDIEHRGAGQRAEAVTGNGTDNNAGSPQISCAAEPPATEKNVWAHRLGSPLFLPETVTGDALDEVALQGSFNGEGTLDEIGPFLLAVSNRVKPGGRLTVHCLTADRHVDGPFNFPGPASVVKSVPCLDSLLDQLDTAGFESVRLTKYGSRPCFTYGEAELRETMIEAFQPVRDPSIAADNDLVTVIYRGPFAEFKLDCGTTVPCGRRTLLPRSTVQRLQSTPVGESLVVIETATAPVSCSG